MLKTKKHVFNLQNIPSFIYGCSDYNDNINTLVLVVLIVMKINKTFARIEYKMK